MIKKLVAEIQLILKKIVLNSQHISHEGIIFHSYNKILNLVPIWNLIDLEIELELVELLVWFFSNK